MIICSKIIKLFNSNDSLIHDGMHAKSTADVFANYDEIVDTLNEISDNNDEMRECRNEAFGITERMGEFEFVFMLEFWKKILNEFDKTSQSLRIVFFCLNLCKLFVKTLMMLNLQRKNDF